MIHEDVKAGTGDRAAGSGTKDFSGKGREPHPLPPPRPARRARLGYIGSASRPSELQRAFHIRSSAAPARQVLNIVVFPDFAQESGRAKAVLPRRGL